MGSVTAHQFSTVRVLVSGVLSADAASTWDVVKDFGAICQWAPHLGSVREAADCPQWDAGGSGSCLRQRLPVSPLSVSKSSDSCGQVSDGCQRDRCWSSARCPHRFRHHSGGAHSYGQRRAYHVCSVPPWLGLRKLPVLCFLRITS